jgi:hypothetical protein
MPPIVATAPWSVVSVRAVGRELRVAFADGTAGVVDLSPLLADPRVESTVFGPLRDPAQFASVFISFGAISWPNGADLAPDAMWDDIKADGVCRPHVAEPAQ